MSYQLCCLIACLLLSTCFGEELCEVWRHIDRKVHNTSFVEYASPKANQVRPFGFKSLKYVKAAGNPCTTIHLSSPSTKLSSEGGKHFVKLKFQIEEGEEIYVRNTITASSTSNLFEEDKVADCIEVPENVTSVQFTFHCDVDNCPNDKVWLWYRLEEIVEDSNSDRKECNQNLEEFPRSFAYYYELHDYDVDDDGDVEHDQIATTFSDPDNGGAAGEANLLIAALLTLTHFLLFDFHDC